MQFIVGNVDVWQLKGNQIQPSYTFVDGHSNKISHLRLSDLSDTMVTAAGPFLHVHQRKTRSFQMHELDVQQWVGQITCIYIHIHVCAVLILSQVLSAQYFMTHLLESYQTWFSGCIMRVDGLF